MTVTVATKQFVDVLSDALRTANDKGVHIATFQAPYKDEPGNVDLLAVTSSTGYVLGHTWIRCDGQLRYPSVWPIASTASVLAICKSLAKKGGENNEHTVDIDMVMADLAEDADVGDHPGWTVTLSETPALFDSDTEFQFHASDESVFPINTVRRLLSGAPRPEGEKVPEPSLQTTWGSGVLEPLVKISSRRGAPMEFYRAEDRMLQRVQIGDTWLGAAMPSTPSPGEATNEPTIESVLGEAELVTILQGMKADGITVTVDNPRGPVAQTLADAVDEVNESHDD